MRSSWLYLATRSVRHGAPVLIWPVLHGHGQVGDGGVLGLAGAVAHDAGVAGLLGHLDGVQRLGQAADLVDLDEDGVRATQLDALRQALGVRDEQVVAHQLHACRRCGRSAAFQPSQSSSAMPSSMEMMGYFSTKRVPVVHHLGARSARGPRPSARTCLSLGVIELGGGRVHGEHDVARRACSRPPRRPSRCTRSGSSFVVKLGAKPPSSPTPPPRPASCRTFFRVW